MVVEGEVGFKVKSGYMEKNTVSSAGREFFWEKILAEVAS